MAKEHTVILGQELCVYKFLFLIEILIFGNNLKWKIEESKIKMVLDS